MQIERLGTDGPVEFWSTASIRAALESGDIRIWQRIVVAVKRDPYGRTARQVEEVLETLRRTAFRRPSRRFSCGLANIWKPMSVLRRAPRPPAVGAFRPGAREFASRIGVDPDDLATYLDGTVVHPLR